MSADPSSAPPRPPCRLFPIFARRAPRAVIFRRGPTNWTELILWRTDTNEFEHGQWFKGRLYERRSDLSPDGSKLIYFARKISGRTLKDREYTYAWTAISKPPYLTALALWPKGDCWHGGGLFDDDHSVFLNHKPEVAGAHPRHQPVGLRVRPNPDAHGEDDPLYSLRLTRDGWKVIEEWKCSLSGTFRGYHTEQPEVRVRRHPTYEYEVRMTRQLDGLTYRETFLVTDREGKPVLDTRGVSWVDWDQAGRLVVLREGKLFVGSLDAEGSAFRLSELADFNPRTHAPIVAPAWATEW